MAEKPILFSGLMVRAVIKGSKTQTRRVRNLDEINVNPDAWHFCGLNGLGNAVFTQDEISYVEVKNPYGDKGTRLWVRETFLLKNAGKSVVYRAAVEQSHGIPEAAGFGAMYGGWKPSIHMPRWASRLTLEITQVRVERVNDISLIDCQAEGITLEGDAQHDGAAMREAFRKLWESINSNRGFGWEKNPWVWAISFRKVEAHAH